MSCPELRFEEEGHIYSLHYEDGAVEVIPSVSEIVKPLEDYSQVHPVTLAKASEYGTNVHKAIELWLNGLLDEERLDEGLVKPLCGFKRFFEPHAGAKFLVEERHYHPKLKYAGTIDLEIVGVLIADYKTRKYNPIVDPVRLAAYKAMRPEFPPLETDVLEIDIDGNCKLINAHHRQAWGVFRKLLDFYKRKKEFETFITKWKGK